MLHVSHHYDILLLMGREHLVPGATEEPGEGPSLAEILSAMEPPELSNYLLQEGQALLDLGVARPIGEVVLVTEEIGKQHEDIHDERGKAKLTGLNVFATIVYFQPELLNDQATVFNLMERCANFSMAYQTLAEKDISADERLTLVASIGREYNG
jgi:hypothetical protein